MNRKNILDARVTGPHMAPGLQFEWTFEARVGSRYGHKWILLFDPGDRSFRVVGLRRFTKRRRQRLRMISQGMLAYLRSRLPASEIAGCMAAAITYQVQIVDPDTIPF